MLEIRNLHAAIDGNEILKGINLGVKQGEVHAIMGPNGSGKSTLAKVLAGHPSYEVTSGEVVFDGKNLLEMSPDERAREGLFMAFQYPIEIPGVSNAQFLRLAYNENQKHTGEEELDPLLSVLDETDSGLDIDALRIVAEGVNKLHDPNKAVILVTHYQRLLNYITPDFVHVLSAGRIVKEGGKELALELEEKGHDWLKNGNGNVAAGAK